MPDCNVLEFTNLLKRSSTKKCHRETLSKKKKQTEKPFLLFVMLFLKKNNLKTLLLR